MGREGRRRVTAEFDLERNTSRVLALFQGALGLHPVDADASHPTAAGPELARQDGSL
jgi:hypothetical protein